MKSTSFLVAAATLAASTQAIDTNATALDATTRRLDGYAMFRMSGVDIVGKDLPGPQTSYFLTTLDLCFWSAFNKPTGTASGASWSNFEGGACWLKATNFQFTETQPNAGVDSVFVVPTNPASVNWSDVKDGFDMAGNDLTNTRRGSMGECKTDCANNNDCYAVTWTNYNGGTCWLKRRASSYVAYAGAKTAYVARRIA